MAREAGDRYRGDKKMRNNIKTRGNADTKAFLFTSNSSMKVPRNVQADAFAFTSIESYIVWRMTEKAPALTIIQNPSLQPELIDAITRVPSERLRPVVEKMTDNDIRLHAPASVCSAPPHELMHSKRTNATIHSENSPSLFHA